MPKVHKVSKARKSNSVAKAGETYYWWKFRRGGKRLSSTYPRRSQLTQSAFLSAMYEAEDNLHTCLSGATALDDVTDALQEAASGVEEARANCEESLANMESAFPNGCPTMELLQNRIDQCEDIIMQLQDAATEIENIDEDEENALEEAISQAGDVSWDFE